VMARAASASATAGAVAFNDACISPPPQEMAGYPWTRRGRPAAVWASASASEEASASPPSTERPRRRRAAVAGRAGTAGPAGPAGRAGRAERVGSLAVIVGPPALQRLLGGGQGSGGGAVGPGPPGRGGLHRQVDER